jgi:hypothetical protein
MLAMIERTPGSRAYPVAGVATAATRSGVWSAETLRSCDPETLSLIIALLLDAEELHAIVARSEPIGGRSWSLAGMIRATVERVHRDPEFAGRLGGRLSERIARENGGERWSAYQALEAWAGRREDTSSGQIALVLSTLAFSPDPVVTSLAGRLCREVQLEAVQRLRSAPGAHPRDGRTW